MKKFLFTCLLLFIINCLNCFSNNCTEINSYSAYQKSLDLKRKVLKQIDLDKLMKENFSKDDMPCSYFLYVFANNSNNIWYKFYCEIIAYSHNYLNYSASFRRQLLYDDSLSLSDHILLALEYANYYNFEMMEKEFQQALIKLHKCPLIIEYIWKPDKLFLINELKKFFPVNRNEKDIMRFYKITLWTFRLFPNINQRSMISAVAIEFLVRNSFYEEAKNLKDLLIQQTQSFGLYGLDVYEISNVYRIELQIMKCLLLILPLLFLFIFLSLKSLKFNLYSTKKAAAILCIVLFLFLILQLDINRNAAVINFLNTSSEGLQYGLLYNKKTSDILNLLHQKSYKAEALFLSALYYYANYNLDRAYNLFQSALEAKNIKKSLKIKIYNNLGVIHFKLKEYEQAKSYFQLALSLDKKFAPSLYNLYLLTGEEDLFDKALKLRKSKVQELSFYNRGEPYIEPLNFKELMRLFSFKKNYFILLKEFLRDNKAVAFYFKIEALLIFIISLFMLTYGKLRKNNDCSWNYYQGKTQVSLVGKLIDILIPGKYFINNYRFGLGVIFFFGFFISLIILIELYKYDSLFISKFALVKEWANIAAIQDYNVIALLNPILYSLFLYILFLTFVPNLLLVILGINLADRQ